MKIQNTTNELFKEIDKEIHAYILEILPEVGDICEATKIATDEILSTYKRELFKELFITDRAFQIALWGANFENDFIPDTTIVSRHTFIRDAKDEWNEAVSKAPHNIQAIWNKGEA